MNEHARPIREGFVTVEEPKTPKPAPPPVIEASPAEAPVADVTSAEEKWPVVVKLLYSKNLRNDSGELVHELSFRQPRGGDINRFGNPTSINQDGEVVINERKMHFIMAALCGILPPLLEAIDPRDWNSCAYRLRGFFLPDLRAW